MKTVEDVLDEIVEAALLARDNAEIEPYNQARKQSLAALEEIMEGVIKAGMLSGGERDSRRVESAISAMTRRQFRALRQALTNSKGDK